jgi:nickel-dependent lactate racemase
VAQEELPDDGSIAMQVTVAYGLGRLDVTVSDARLVGTRRLPPASALADPAAAVRAALEAPHQFPALRRALTPDDHVTIVVEQSWSRLPELLVPVLEHIRSAGVQAEAITVVAPPVESVPTPNGLPETHRGFRWEVHDPADRERLSYLAATRAGRRVYLNRSAVDADQVVVLTRRRYDPVLGYGGAEGALFPTLSDKATRQEIVTRITTAAPAGASWSAQQEAEEVAWLLGAPFMVQIIEGAGDAITHVLAGLAGTRAEGQRLLDARWRVVVDHPADTVLVSISGDPASQDFGELARAVACAARVVKPQGRIVVLSMARPFLGPGAASLRQSEDPERALASLRQEHPPDLPAAFQWASAAQHARIHLLSEFPTEVVEELYAVPLENTRQALRLLEGDGSLLILEDANKALAVVGAS